jgi:hypothetical protein
VETLMHHDSIENRYPDLISGMSSGTQFKRSRNDTGLG